MSHRLFIPPVATSLTLAAMVTALWTATVVAEERKPHNFEDHGLVAPAGMSTWGPGEVATVDGDGRRVVFIKLWTGSDASYLFVDAETGETEQIRPEGRGWGAYEVLWTPGDVIYDTIGERAVAIDAPTRTVKTVGEEAAHSLSRRPASHRRRQQPHQRRGPDHARKDYRLCGGGFLQGKTIACVGKGGLHVRQTEPVIEAAGGAVILRGGGKVDNKTIVRRTEGLINEGASGIVYGRNVIGFTRALMALLHKGICVEAALKLVQI